MSSPPWCAAELDEEHGLRRSRNLGAAAGGGAAAAGSSSGRRRSLSGLGPRQFLRQALSERRETEREKDEHAWIGSN